MEAKKNMMVKALISPSSGDEDAAQPIGADNKGVS